MNYIEEEKEKIIKELIDTKKIKEGQAIDYEYFLELYEPYKDKMSETEFASLLGITYGNYMSIKNQGTKAKVLKNRKKAIKEEEKEEIIKELIRSKKIKEGQAIDYEYFLELYEPYKDRMSEIEFASLLGITYDNYLHIKNKGTRAKVHNYYNKRKIDRIKYELTKEERYYLKEEIEELCKKYEVDIDLILQNIFCAGKKEYVSDYRDLLNKKGKIWIGNVKCSKEFANKHSKIIIEEIGKISRKLCSRYRCMHIAQDIGSDAIVYILEKCGDIDKNFNDNDEIAKRIIIARAYIYIKYKCLTKLRKPKETSFEKKFTYKGSEEESNIFDRGIKDETSQDVQDEVQGKILKERVEKEKGRNIAERCIKILSKNIGLGLSREEAILKTGEILGIEPREMLQMLKEYMIRNKKVKETKDGEYVLRE